MGTSLLRAVLLLVAIIAVLAVAVVSVQSPAVADDPDRTIPTITVSSPSAGEVQVVWDTPSETDTLSSYRVSWALWETDEFTSYEDANSDTGGNAYPDAPASSYTITGLSSGEYAVYVRAKYDDQRNGDFTKSAKVAVADSAQQDEETPTPTPEPTPEPTATPGAITGLTLTSSRPGHLWISWGEASPAPTEYRLNWAQVDDPFPSWDSRDGGNLWLPRTAQDFSGLVDPGVTYKLRMRAIYKTGPDAPWSGPWSETVTQRVRNDPPGAPTAVSVDSVAHDGIVLSWSAPDHNGLTGYRILRGSSADALVSIVDDTGDLATGHTDTTVSEDTTYHYAVAALSLDGDGGQSATVSATTPPPQTPGTPVIEGAPAAPASLAASLDGAGGVTLSWTYPDDDAITGYRVLRGGDALSMRVIKEDTGSAAVSYTDTSPKADRTYVYAVQARNAAGLSQLSNTASVTVPAATETNQPRGVLPPFIHDEPEISLRQSVDPPATALLSNIGQTTAETNQFTDTAQPFGSGANTGGYVLTSIEINTNVEAGQDLSYLPTLKVHSGSATGTEVAALTAPSSTTPTLTYTAPDNTTLAASTTYWVVSTGGQFGHWNLADSTTLDSGAATGWTIPGKAQDKVGSTFTDFTGSRYFKIRVNGYARTPADQPGTVSLSEDQPEMGIPLTATLTDDDGEVSGTTWQWSSSDTASGTFADISGAASATYRPAETDLEKYLRATASYTDSLASGKSASGTSTSAVNIVSDIWFLNNINTAHSTEFASGGPGITQQFTTGGHPAGYKISSLRFWVYQTASTSQVSAHIYSSNSNGTPNGSLFQLVSQNSNSITGRATFTPPVGARLSPDTNYHLALFSTGPNPGCEISVGGYSNRVSDWTLGYAYQLNSQGAFSGNTRFTFACGMSIRGEPALDTSYVKDLEITNSPADTNGYVVGETLEATVTMSEAVTVDTGTPPTLSVVIGSTTRTMTYNATDSTSTKLQFDYTLVAEDEDTDGVSFDADALTGTITRTSDSKAAELEHAAVPDDADAKVVDLVVVDVEFGASTYTVAETDDATTTDEEEHKVEVTVTLSADPGRTVIIPITKTNEGGATNSDYSGVPASVTFASGETEQTFTFTATADSADDDEDKVKLGFGTLPAGVTAGTTSETTVSITDDDFPQITVSFGAATYSVDEGFSVTIEVTLSADPERDLLIPLTRTFLGTASTDDLDSESPTTVQFNDDVDQTTISFRTEDDTVEDHGESVRLGFGDLPEGVTASGTTTTIVTIIDDDPAVTIEFDSTTYSVTEGNSVTVTVTLSEDPKRPLTIPVTAIAQGTTSTDDYTDPTSVTFASGQTSRTLSFSVTEDTTADHGESVVLAFGSDLPPGASAGDDDETTVTIIDDDPAVTVGFEGTAYSVEEGESVDVTLTLSDDPMRPLTIPIAVVLKGTTSTDDYTDPASVTFSSGDTSATFSFSVTEDAIADHGESVNLGFRADLPPGVSEGTPDETTVTIIDDDPAVTVGITVGTPEVEEGDRARIIVEFDEPPVRPISIPLTFTYRDGADANDLSMVPTSADFSANSDGSVVLYPLIFDDTIPDDGESFEVGFGTDLPPGVSIHSAGATGTVTIIDNDPAVTASFGAATYSADEGDSVDVTVTLSADPQRSVTIPIAGTGESGGTSADFSVPDSVTFASGDTSKTISFTATDDTIDDDDEKVKLAFGTFPPGVSAGSTSTTKVSINDDDDPELTVMFGNAAYTATEGGTTTVSVTLSADPERTVVVPISVTRESGAAASDYSGIPSSVTFVAGDTSESFTFTAVDDDIDDDGEKVKLSFGTLPARVTEGSVDESTVSITDNDTRGVTITPTALSIIELAWDDYTVVLDTEPTGEVTITITDPTDSEEAEVPTGSLTFTTDNWDMAQSVRVNVSGDYEDEPDETATVTHSASGGDYGSVTVDSVVVTIEDDDETPVITGSATPSFAEIEYDADQEAAVLTVATYTATDGDGDDITWSLAGRAGSRFTLTENDDGGAVLAFAEPPDFENPGNYFEGYGFGFRVEASDGTNIAELLVFVTLTNVNERPNVGTLLQSIPTEFSVDEPAYHTTQSTSQRHMRQVAGVDPEGDNLTWSLAGADAGDFTVTPHPAYAALGNVLSNVHIRNQPDYENPADADMDNEYHVIVRASDGKKTGEVSLVIRIDDINERPDIDEDTVADYKEIEFDSTDTPGSVHTFGATDYDEDDTFTWSLEGDDADDFEIGSSTGVLTFKQVSGSDPLPDFEDAADHDSDNTYEITVKATDDDSTPLSSTHAVTVEVTNINETPEFTGSPETAISYDEKKTESVTDYNARDEEGTTITWSLTGTDRGDFAISTDGIVTFKKTPNYEDPEDSNDDNVYSFRVNASDGDNSRNLGVTVTVVDLEEAGVITVSNLNPGVGDELSFALTDPDGGLKDISWNLESRASSTASWSAVSGWFTSVSQATLATYSVTEDVTGHELRMRVDYADRRTTATDDPGTLLVNEGQDKTATSDDTEPVTADPIVNAPPRFRAGGDFSISEGEAGRNVGTPLVVSDRDNDTLRFGIEAGAGDDFFAVHATSGQLSLLKAVDFEAPPTVGFYLITITLHDGKDADGNVETDPVVDATTGVSVTVTDVEEEGVVTLSAEEPESGTKLTATLEDGDGSVSGESWQWARSENGRTDWINIAGKTSSSYTPTVDDEDFYLRARVEYTDNRGSGKSAEGVTTGPVPSENRRPTFPDTETGDRTVDENTRARVNIGAPVAASDPERNRLTYTLTGTDADAFTIVAGTGQLRTKDPLDHETTPSYSVTVNVHDGRDGSGATSTNIDDTQDVTITVENVEEPGTVTLTTDTEHISARVEVTAVLTDPDGSVTGVTWQWSQSPNGRTGWANIAGADQDTYTPLDGHEDRYIRATASYTDGHGANKIAHGVSPRRVAEPPPVNSAPAFPSTENGRREVAEDAGDGDTIGDPVAATDLNAGDAAVNDPLVYSLTGTDAASFTINAATGQLALAEDVELDFEGKRSYRVTVQVTDGRDQNGDDDSDVIDDTINVTITVTNVNEAPTVTGEATASFAENDSGAIATYTGTDPDRGDTLTWSVSGTDSASFAMTERGRLHFASPPSFEGGKTEYAVTVVATDEGEPGLTDSVDVTVTVTDVEEEGAVAITPPRGWTDTEFSAALTDDDGITAGTETWQWARSTNRSSWTDITGQTSSAYTATADDVGNYLRVSTEYTDSRGGGKTASAVLAVRIADAADRPTTNATPEFADATTTRSISQGTASGRSIGAAVRATDVDRDDVLIYSLSGTDADKFDIDPATGQLRTKAVLAYDPEGQNTYTVTVEVHDGFDQQYAPLTTADDSIDVTITVTVTAPRSPRRITPTPGPQPAPDPDPETESETSTGGGTSIAFVQPVTASEPAPAVDLQPVEQLFQELKDGGNLVRVWRLVPETQRWLFYDPDPQFAPFNSLKDVDLASDPPAIVIVGVSRGQLFRGYNLYTGWNFVPLTAEPLSPQPGSGAQPVQQIFQGLAESGVLQRVWWLDSRTQEWKFYDPRPEFAALNTLTTIDLAASPPEVLVVGVTRQQEFRGITLFLGWNYIVVN